MINTLSNYLRLRSRAELNKATQSTDAVAITNGMKRAKNHAIKAMEIENKEKQ